MDSECPICLFSLLSEIQGGSQNGSQRRISFARNVSSGGRAREARVFAKFRLESTSSRLSPSHLITALMP